MCHVLKKNRVFNSVLLNCIMGCMRDEPFLVSEIAVKQPLQVEFVSHRVVFYLIRYLCA